MIYLADDYLEKYSDALSYLLGRAMSERYSFDHIERAISHSQLAEEMENSNVTTIAFSSNEMLYLPIFPLKENSGYRMNPYGIEGWMGILYIHLFLELKITFEALFLLLPIEECQKMYPLYHEMDISQAIEAAKQLKKHTYLDCFMNRRGISSSLLSQKSGIPLATVKALRYGMRDINRLEAAKLLRLAQALKIKIETLLSPLPLVLG